MANARRPSPSPSPSLQLRRCLQALLPLSVQLTGLLAADTARADEALAEQALQVPLDCRLGDGSWQPCTLTVERLGERWWLQVADRRLDFSSDGRGEVTVQEAGGSLRRVQPVWTAQQDLCWDGICTRGDLPLD